MAASKKTAAKASSTSAKPADQIGDLKVGATYETPVTGDAIATLGAVTSSIAAWKQSESGDPSRRFEASLSAAKDVVIAKRVA